MDRIIDSVIIDTSAFEAKQFDFLGITSNVIISLFELIKTKNVQLLNHPVLSGECKNHIKTMDLVRSAEGQVKHLSKYRDIYNLAGLPVEDMIEAMRALSLADRITEAYDSVYKNAIALDYPNPMNVFHEYFESLPPFSTNGDKKHEFPDAFVLDAVKEYTGKYPGKLLLVISGDNDWRAALADTKGVWFVKTIEDGIKALQNPEKIIPLFIDNKAIIEERILEEAGNESYSTIDDYGTVDEVEIDSIDILELKDDFLLLRITEETVLVQCYATITADGTAIMFDEENSVYDSETHRYILTHYNTISFNNAIAEIDCEVEIKTNSKDSVEIGKVRINVPYHDIMLNLDDAQIKEEDGGGWDFITDNID